MAEIVDFGLQQHKIKMDSRYFENVLSVVAGDTGRRLEVQLLDTNGMVQNTTGLSLRLNAEIAGKATYTDATLIDAVTGKYQLDLSNGMFLAPGNWQFQWRITDSAGKKLHSFAFTGNVGSNISEGGSQATNFYLNLEDLKQMQEDFLNGNIDSAVLETNIAEKLTDLETQYAPKLTEVTAQLAQNVDKNPIYLTDYGVKSTNTPAQNTTMMKQAILDASIDNRPIIVPWVSSDQWIDINEPLVVKAGIKISGYGNDSKIRQTVFPNPIFDLRSPDASVEDLYLSGTDFDARGYAIPYRGTQQQSFFAGVVACSDRNKVKRIKVDNMITGVLFSAFDVDASAVRSPLDECVAEDIEVSNVDFGLVVQGVKNFYYNNIKGSYRLMPGSSTPPHLIYFDGTNGKNTNITGGTSSAYNGIDGHAFQLKGIEGGNIASLYANNCSGVLNCMDSDDVTIGTVTSLKDTYPDQNYSSLYLQTRNSKITIDRIIVKMSSDGKPIRIDNETTESTLRNLSVESNHNVVQPPTSFDVEVRGLKNKVENVEVINKGSYKNNASVGIWSGTENVISNPKTSGNDKGVIIRSAGNNLVNYNPKNISETIKLQLYGKSNIEMNQMENIGSSEQDRLIAYERAIFISTSGLLEQTTSGHPWILSSGQFSTGDGFIFSTSGVPGVAIVDVDSPNIDLSSGIKYINREGLAVRVIDKNNLIGIRFRHDTGVATIFKHDESVYSVLAEKPYVAQVGRRYRLRIVAYGNLIEAYVDNSLLLTATLSESDMVKFGNITTHGLFANANPDGKYDNIEWRNIE